MRTENGRESERGKKWGEMRIVDGREGEGQERKESVVKGMRDRERGRKREERKRYE